MEQKGNKDVLKNIMWSLVTIVIAVLTITAITSQAKGFSINDAWIMIKHGKKGFMALAMVSVILYIYLEGVAIKYILKHISVNVNHRQAFLYSAADIYFSAITPSASGGQPASFYFMRKDGVSFSKATMCLVLNLLMYSFAIDFVAVLSFVVRPDIFNSFNDFGKVLIVLGFVIMTSLTLFFFMLLKEPKWMDKLGLWGISILGKLKIIRKPEKKRVKWEETVKKYSTVSDLALGKGKMLFVAFLINLAQRVTQISITVFVYLGLGGKFRHMADIWFSQAFAFVGSNCAPIPGAQGVVDYLMIQGFSQFMPEPVAVHTELLSRGMSFYICIFISLITTVIGYLVRRKRADN